MKLSIFFLTFFCLTSCFDWCPGIPGDFEEGTEKPLPDEYFFPYQYYSTCQIKTVGFTDSMDVKLVKTLDNVVPDTSFHDECEDGYQFKTEKHLLKFSHDSLDIDLSISYNHFNHQMSPELKLTGILMGNPIEFYNITASENGISIDSTYYRYYGNPTSKIDKISDADGQKMILLEFEK